MSKTTVLTAQKLKGLSFIEKERKGEKYYDQDGFILKRMNNVWLFCAEHSGEIITTLLYIETEKQLEMLQKLSRK
ncbi:MAG: hypothetical protein RBR78_10815 [Flavobacteriaceae bacterium]|jgi:hypothetical protein|nr:hypothetical protein [Flavobacteriaceae bacterium]